MRDREGRLGGNGDMWSTISCYGLRGRGREENEESKVRKESVTCINQGNASRGGQGSTSRVQRITLGKKGEGKSGRTANGAYS